MRKLLILTLVIQISCSSIETRTIRCLDTSNHTECISNYLMKEHSDLFKVDELTKYLTVKTISENQKYKLFIIRLNGSHNPYYGIYVGKSEVIMIEPVSSKQQLYENCKDQLSKITQEYQIIANNLYDYLYTPKTF